MRRLWFLFPILVAGYILGNIWINQSFCITRYTVTSGKIGEGFKGVLIADLHDTEYGEDNEKLLEAIRKEDPDVILLAGDIVSNTTHEYSELLLLLKNLGMISPTYYSFGNHEYGLDLSGRFTCLEEIQNTEGVKLLRYGIDDTEIKGNKVRIGGMSVDMSGWEKHGKRFFELFEDTDDFFILMSHYPWLVPEYYPETTVDAVLSGHAHGGQVHLWGDVGLFAPGKGWFANLTSGTHNINGTTEIVTRGLGDHTIVPRINNQPELVVIDFVPEKGD